MKTTHTSETIREFLLANKQARPDSIHPLVEGHVSQAFSFENKYGEKLVLRIAPRADDFLHDKYAFEKFAGRLPIPQIREIGMFDDASYFSVSDFVEGVPSNTLKQEQIDAMQSEILRSYAALFTSDISHTSGYGPLEVVTGNGQFSTWRERIEDELNNLDPDEFRIQAKEINLDVTIVDKLLLQARNNLQFAPETRRLIHGDLGFDNMLIANGKVAALIDWAHIGYGDWMYDYAKIEFWWPGRHDDKHAFSIAHGLDVNNLDQREALYWATTALGTIRWAGKSKNEKIAEWLRANVPDRLVGN